MESARHSGAAISSDGPGGHRRGKSFHITDPDRSRQPHKRPAVIINSWTQVSRHELLHTDAAPVLETQFLPCSRGTWGLDMTPFPAPRQTIEPWNKTGLNYFKLIQAIHHKSNINKALKRRLTETQGPEWMSAGEDVSSLIKPAESRWFVVAVNPIFFYMFCTLVAKNWSKRLQVHHSTFSRSSL